MFSVNSRIAHKLLNHKVFPQHFRHTVTGEVVRETVVYYSTFAFVYSEDAFRQ